MSINYQEYCNDFLNRLELNIAIEWKSAGEGFNIKLPELKFKYDTFVIVNLCNPLTIVDNIIFEFHKIEFYYAEYVHRIIVIQNTPGITRYHKSDLNVIEFHTTLFDSVNELEQDAYFWNIMLQQPKSQTYYFDYHFPDPNGHDEKIFSILHNWEEEESNNKPEHVPEIPKIQQLRKMVGIKNLAEVNIIRDEHYHHPGPYSKKIFLSMAIEQIPIVIGYPGIIEDLESLGFDMFRDLVDTTYEFADDADRYKLALELNKDLILGKIDLLPYRERLKKQREHLYSMKMSMLENLKNQIFTFFKNAKGIDVDLRII